MLCLTLTAWSCFLLRHMAAIAALPVTALMVWTAVRRTGLTCRDLNRAFAYLHGLLAAALYMPILIPAIFASGTAWSQGLLFALGIFPVGVWLAERGMNCEIK